MKNVNGADRSNVLDRVNELSPGIVGSARICKSNFGFRDSFSEYITHCRIFMAAFALLFPTTNMVKS